ncbi:MAG: metal ABC transporter permease [Burkholderiales bacterium]|nr:metal ABC transporter permease [Opitutaceae bacterium]
MLSLVIGRWSFDISAALAPFEHAFMLQAFGLGALIAAVCAVLSCFLVLRGWSLMGDAVSHAVLPGVVLAYAAGLPLGVGAFVSGLLCATGTGWIKRHTRVKEDTVMGVVFTGLFALGLVLHSRTPSDLHLNHVLFGNLLGIEKDHLVPTVVLCAVVLVVVLALRRTLLLAAFDPSHARAIGFRIRFLDTVLLILLALAIVAALQAVGIILVVAMLVTPGATAFLLAKRFDRMLAVALAVSIGSTLAGVYISFFADANTAACIVLFQAAAFVAALLFAPGKGLLLRRASA